MSNQTSDRNPVADALEAILQEAGGADRPYSTDSYLPSHLIESARTALNNDRADRADREKRQAWETSNEYDLGPSGARLKEGR